MGLLMIFYVLFAHWVADFIFQDEEWATSKSKNIFALLKHVSMYAFVMTLFLMPLMSFMSIILFAYWIFMTHFIIDFITSKIVSNKFANKHLGSKIPNFGAFTIIGFDQWLHYVTIFLIIKLLM